MSYAERRNGKLTGRWFAHVRKHRLTGEELREAYDRKEDADAAEGYFKAKGTLPPELRGARREHTIGGPTFADVAAQMKSEGGNKGKWRRGRDVSLMQRLEHCCHVIGSTPINAITTATLLRITEDLRKRPGRMGQLIAPSTINRYQQTAGAVLHYACRRGIRTVPAPEIPKLDEKGRGREEYLSDTQLASVCGYCLEQGWTLEERCFQFLAASGLRLGELESLRPEQVTNNKVVLHSDQTKTDSPRTVYVAPELARDIRAIIASGALPHRKRLLRAFRAACDARGFPRELVLHSLRHTAGTRLLEVTHDVRLVQQFLGHKVLQTTERYTHVANKRLEDAAEKLAHERGFQPSETSDNVHVFKKEA